VSEVSEICEEAIDAAAGSRTTGLGVLEACRLYLSQHKIPAHQLPVLYGRLGEALLHKGLREEAVDCARIAFELQPDEEEIANVCAWIFSNCGRWDEAAAAYERLLESRPDWSDGHRHASGSLAAAGQLDRAIFHAGRASDLAPKSVEFAVHAASQCEAAGRYTDAVTYFMRAAAAAPEEASASVLRQLSGAKFALGQCDEAVALALRALSLAPDERLNSLHATELLLRTGQLDKAAEVIHDTLAMHPQDDVALRMLSATQMLRGCTEEALDAIERALAIKSETAEYHLHRANLLYRLGRLDDAAEAFGRAAELDPANPAAKRSQLTVYYDSGRFTEALAIGGELMRISPENEEYAQAVLQVLNRRFDALDGDYVVLSERTLRPPGRPRPPPGWFEALQTQVRVIHALIIRETRTRFGDSKLGYGWALLEPILHILMLSLVFAVMMHGRPPIGDQFFIFYYTGIIPYHLFVHTSTSMTYAITSNGSLLQLPLVGTFDVLMARALLELVTDTLVAVILLAGFGAIGIGALPQDLTGVSAALLVVWVLGCGFGFLNAVVNAFTKSWDKIWAQLTRLLYFCSGIFYVPGIMPDWIRDILSWNPVLHGVDWFRSSFFREYEPHWLDRSYLSAVALAALLVGLGLQRTLRRRLCEPL
jgi:ABC-type polysaccharide/polyol phosphate export permease/Flp pilus assembly protein TadD